MKRRVLLLLVLSFTASVFGQTTSPEGPIYDAQGHLIAYQYADGKRDTYSYDASWRMITFLGRDGTLTHYIYKSDGTAEAVRVPTKAP